MTQVPLTWPLIWYLALSFVAFLMYGADKRAAQHGRWRTSEASLHLVDLLGGWPGALVAQQVFRHKTRKVSFQVVFWLTVVVNLGLLAMSLLVAAA